MMNPLPNDLVSFFSLVSQQFRKNLSIRPGLLSKAPGNALETKTSQVLPLTLQEKPQATYPSHLCKHELHCVWVPFLQDDKMIQTVTKGKLCSID